LFIANSADSVKLNLVILKKSTQMKITLSRQNDAVHFIAKNEQALTMAIDGSPEIGGENKGFRPMQLLLVALGGCSSIDIVSILKKQRQVLEGFDIEVDGDREAGKEPSLFRDIIVTFKLTGALLDPEKVKKAVALSLEKYCSVAKTLEPTATIKSVIVLNGEII
jgi:putative redox protein